MKRIFSAIFAFALLLPFAVHAQTSGGVTAFGAIKPGDIAGFKSSSQIQRLGGVPINGQCLVYSGTYPTGSWGTGPCVAAGAGTVTQVTATAGTGMTLTGICTSVTVFTCQFALTPQITAAGPIGDASHVAAITYNASGQLTVVSSVAISIPFSQVTGNIGCSQQPAFTGDVTNVNCALTIGALKVVNGMIAASAVDNSKIAALAVDNPKMAVGAAAANLGTASVTPVKGGTGIDNSSSSTNEVLAWNGSGFIHSALMTVINNICTLTPTPCYYLFGHLLPEWFGATPSVQGAAAGTVVNNQTQIQNTISFATTFNGAVKIYFHGGVYGIGNGIGGGSNIIFEGAGRTVTTLLFQPSTPAAAVTFSNGAAIVFNCGISNLAIQTVDTTITKIGLAFVDSSSCIVRNVQVSAYQSGRWTATSAAAVGVQIQGRELGVFENCYFFADTPMQISANPHVPGTAEDLDSFSFHDMYLVGQIPGTTKNLIQVDAGVSIYNTTFDGHQNWVGGVDGFHWIGGNSIISTGLYISGVKDEQSGNSGGYMFNIQPNTQLYGLHISNAQGSQRNGILLRNVSNTLLESVTFDGTTSFTKIGLNADLTNTMIDIRSCAWITGTTATLGAFSASAFIFPTGYSGSIPASGVFFK